MILVDTSVWIDHFQRKSATLTELLDTFKVLSHPSVIGELACGNLPERPLSLRRLNSLKQAPAARSEEVLRLVEERKLFGLGIGWIDAHLIASALLAGCDLWTLDRPLQKAAARAGVTLFAAHRPNGHH